MALHAVRGDDATNAIVDLATPITSNTSDTHSPSLSSSVRGSRSVEPVISSFDLSRQRVEQEIEAQFEVHVKVVHA